MACEKGALMWLMPYLKLALMFEKAVNRAPLCMVAKKGRLDMEGSLLAVDADLTITFYARAPLLVALINKSASQTTCSRYLNLCTQKSFWLMHSSYR